MTKMPWSYPEVEWCIGTTSFSVPQAASKTNLKALARYMFGDLDVMGVVVALGSFSVALGSDVYCLCCPVCCFCVAMPMCMHACAYIYIYIYI